MFHTCFLNISLRDLSEHLFHYTSLHYCLRSFMIFREISECYLFVFMDFNSLKFFYTVFKQNRRVSQLSSLNDSCWGEEKLIHIISKFISLKCTGNTFVDHFVFSRWILLSFFSNTTKHFWCVLWKGHYLRCTKTRFKMQVIVIQFILPNINEFFW